MKLHIFNPEHDIALASGLANFTAPHAGRRLRADLGYLPALWAAEGDCVLVENAALARRTFGRLRARLGYHGDKGDHGAPAIPRFIETKQLDALKFDEVEPWGWDAALRTYLLRHGVKAVPTDKEIADIRDLSHRRHAAAMLRQLMADPAMLSAAMPGGDLGMYAVVAETLDDFHQQLRRHQRIVVKAPWSSSGRGVRFIDRQLTAADEGWIRNVIARQGAVTVEPYYNKVKDFGMEFESISGGCVRYLGLSLFDTRAGAYTGNIVAPEADKREMLARYVAPQRLDTIALSVSHALGRIVGDRYRGPLGVDMMVIARTDGAEGFFVNPCVEINLRRTMGHVALAIPESPDGKPRTMRIELTDKYRLRITSTI